MKKLISMAIAAVMSLSMAVAVHAENNPKVYIDGAQIYFADQQPVILGAGTTLVPARGVFETMGLNVNWDGEKRLVSVDTPDNITRIRLTIDDPVMKVYTAKSIMDADLTEVELGVAPQIIGDRTMIPLRAISEAVGADVKWDGKAYSVFITSKDYEEYIPPEDPDIPSGEGVKTAMSLTSSVDSVSEGDIVDIYVNIANMPSDAYLSGLATTVSYSKEDFEYVSCSLLKGGQDLEMSDDNVDAPAGVLASNPDYHNGAGLKAVIITLDDSLPRSGKIARLTFKAKTSNGGDFALINSYDMSRGYDNAFTLMQKDTNEILNIDGEDLYVDTTAVTVSGK